MTRRTCFHPSDEYFVDSWTLHAFRGLMNWPDKRMGARVNKNSSWMRYRGDLSSVSRKILAGAVITRHGCLILVNYWMTGPLRPFAVFPTTPAMVPRSNRSPPLSVNAYYVRIQRVSSQSCPCLPPSTGLGCTGSHHHSMPVTIRRESDCIIPIGSISSTLR